MDLQKLRDSMNELHETFGFKAGLMMHFYAHYHKHLHGNIVEAFIKGFDDAAAPQAAKILTAEDVMILHQIFSGTGYEAQPPRKYSREMKMEIGSAQAEVHNLEQQLARGIISQDDWYGRVFKIWRNVIRRVEMLEHEQEAPEVQEAEIIEEECQPAGTEGGRYEEIMRKKLSFAPFGEAGHVRVKELENLVILNAKYYKIKTGRGGQYENERTYYDVSPVLQHIFHHQRTNGGEVVTPWALFRFSHKVPKLRISSQYLYDGATKVSENIAMRIIKLAYVLNGCVAGLPHK
ncbi:hypothetical protein AYK24_00035 [Thermoplasmatales archaeon SG8-52-4]|nr:MAG: hypothetical protein AYK24_00035 [Thermoplasmatales archaeon SG8-52-4]